LGVCWRGRGKGRRRKGGTREWREGGVETVENGRGRGKRSKSIRREQGERVGERTNRSLARFEDWFLLPAQVPPVAVPSCAQIKQASTISILHLIDQRKEPKKRELNAPQLKQRVPSKHRSDEYTVRLQCPLDLYERTYTSSH
jgi:hypothetical protein